LLTILLLPVAAYAQEDLWDDDAWEEDAAGTAWTGFVEAGLGTRFSEDPLVDTRATLEDLRWRVETQWQPRGWSIELKADLGYDGIEQEAIAELRDLSLSFSVGDSTDVRLGRQVLTWGTGDLVFLNDLFPKDFVSFFAGRDDEYLKAPGNALRITHFTPLVNVDFAWSPEFDPDVYLTGERFSFFSPRAGGNVAPQPPLSALEPRATPANGEFAVRLFRTIAGREYALYGYRGFFKQPSAVTASGQATFAPLGALGVSLRQPAGPGILHLETAYYDSRDDRDGDDPRIPNDQWRFVAGYEWEAVANFTVGLQYYLERTLDYGALRANSAAPAFEAEKNRQVLTNRLTYRAGRDRYLWSLFTFYSPSDRDAYFRPAFTYRYSDQWSLSAGANVFTGSEAHTFFNQLQDASNVYLRLRLSY